jgi:hypothetical protein
MKECKCKCHKRVESVEVVTVPVMMTEEELYSYMFSEQYLTSDRFFERYPIDIHCLSLPLRTELTLKFCYSFPLNPFDKLPEPEDGKFY